MPLASSVLRSAARKAANGLRSTHPTNGGTHQGGGGGTGSRALHTAPSRLSTANHSEFIHQFTTTLNQIRPRTPAHKLFSSTRGFFANFFTRLAAPGVRVPTVQNVGRSLMQARPLTIQSGLSLPIRHTITNNFRSLGSGTFLPRAAQVPVRGPIASQLGLGTARNFSSGRPIFQNLIDNVPVAVRALYEADLDDLKSIRNKQVALRRIAVTSKKAASPKISKLKARTIKSAFENTAVEEKSPNSADFERYFSVPAIPAVTTHLLIPLAPTPTNRVPLSALEGHLEDLPPDPALHMRTGRFLPLPQIGEAHRSHSNHALRVSTLFARLDQANVWSRGGVVCSAYSGPGAGVIRPRRRDMGNEAKLDSSQFAELEGICTVLKIEFQGWTEAEVRGVIGESGKGWCVLEEVWTDEEDDGQGILSAAEDEGELIISDSGMSSPAFFASPRSTPAELGFDMGMPDIIDPAQSFVLPTLDFSSSFLSSANERTAFGGGSNESGGAPQATLLEYEDPWFQSEEYDADGDGYMSSDDSLSSFSLSRSTSTSSFEDVAKMMGSAPASPLSQTPSRSRFGFSSRFYDAASATEVSDEPRETMF